MSLQANYGLRVIRQTASQGRTSLPSKYRKNIHQLGATLFPCCGHKLFEDSNMDTMGPTSTLH